MADDERDIVENLPEVELDQLSSEDLDQLYNHIVDKTGLGIPQEEDKSNMFSFFRRILDSLDTRKASNVDEEELRAERVLLNASNLLNILKYKTVPTYLTQKAEIIASTSLGKEGFLIKSAITQKKYLSTDARKKSEGAKNKGWFSKKESSQKEEF